MKRPWWWPAARALAGRPELLGEAARQLAGLAPRRWWARLPPLPLPERRWLAFRLETAYGDSGAPADPKDVVSWLEWCRGARRRDAAMRYRPRSMPTPRTRGASSAPSPPR